MREALLPHYAELSPPQNRNISLIETFKTSINICGNLKELQGQTEDGNIW